MQSMGQIIHANGATGTAVRTFVESMAAAECRVRTTRPPESKADLFYALTSRSRMQVLRVPVPAGGAGRRAGGAAGGDDDPRARDAAPRACCARCGRPVLPPLARPPVAGCPAACHVTDALCGAWQLRCGRPHMHGRSGRLRGRAHTRAAVACQATRGATGCKGLFSRRGFANLNCRIFNSKFTICFDQVRRLALGAMRFEVMGLCPRCDGAEEAPL